MTANPPPERVRTTVDLDPTTHKSLRQWALDEDVKIVDVWRALLHRLLTDEQVARKVRRDLQGKQITRHRPPKRS